MHDYIIECFVTDLNSTMVNMEP